MFFILSFIKSFNFLAKMIDDFIDLYSKPAICKKVALKRKCCLRLL